MMDAQTKVQAGHRKRNAYLYILCSAINPFAVESTSCQQRRNIVTSRLGRCYVDNPSAP